MLIRFLFVKREALEILFVDLANGIFFYVSYNIVKAFL